MKKVYIAGPWFTTQQLEIIENIKTILGDLGVLYFSPKDENLFSIGSNPKDILDVNIRAIEDAQYIIAVTDDKDVGTIFECGYAYSINKPILYLWLGHKPGLKFNLMLAASGITCLNYQTLTAQIMMYKEHGVFVSQPQMIADEDIE